MSIDPELADAATAYFARNLALAILGCLVVLAPSTATALVMCGQATAGGSLRQGAPVRLRDSCRSNEVKIEPGELGLRGPQGPSGGMIVRDENQAEIGRVVGDGVTASWGINVEIADTTYGGLIRPVVVRLRSSGFGPAPVVFFAAPNCTGAPYVRVDAEDLDPLIEAQVIGGVLTNDPRLGSLMNGPGTIAYYPTGPSEWVQPGSRAEVVAGPQACFSGQTFFAPSTCCTDLAPLPIQLLPAGAVPLAFEPPFRVMRE